MKCPICNAWTLTLETRKHDKDNTVWRRKECGNMHVFVTLEQVTEGAATRPNNKGVVAVQPSLSTSAERVTRKRKRTEDD